MKHFTLSILFCIPLLLSGQNKTFLEVNFGIHHTNRLLHLENQSTVSVGFFNGKSFEKGKYNPSIFIGISKQVNPFISLKSGVQFHNYRVSSENIIIGMEKRSLTRSIISIPMLGKLEFFHNKSWRPYFETGIITSYIVRETQSVFRTDTQEELATSTFGTSDMMYDPLIFSIAYNIGFTKDLSTKSQLFIQASSSFQVDQLNHFGVSERLYKIGFNAGIKLAI